VRGEGEGLSARQGFDRRFVVKKRVVCLVAALWRAGPVGTGGFFFLTLFSFGGGGAL